MNILHALALAKRARGRWQAVERTLPTLCRDARAAGLSVRAIADALGLTRMHVHRLLHGRSDRPGGTAISNGIAECTTKNPA